MRRRRRGIRLPERLGGLLIRRPGHLPMQITELGMPAVLGMPVELPQLVRNIGARAERKEAERIKHIPKERRRKWIIMMLPVIAVFGFVVVMEYRRKHR